VPEPGSDPYSMPGYHARRRRRIAIITAVALLLLLGWLPSYSQRECVDLVAGRRELRHRLLGITCWREPLLSPLAALYAEHVGRWPRNCEWRAVRDQWFELYGLVRYQGEPSEGGESYWLLSVALPRLVVNEPLGGGLPLNAYGFSEHGKRELILRGLEAARCDDLHHPLSTYIGRVQEAVEYLSYPAGPEDFPTVSEALDDDVFDVRWRPRIERLAAANGPRGSVTGGQSAPGM
jgi:hypothetical protein